MSPANEKEVRRLVRYGVSIREIARRLGLSKSAVSRVLERDREERNALIDAMLVAPEDGK